MERVKITEEDWDYLIILDACRYDFFKEVYSKYLKGKLEKKNSVGSSTTEWRNKSFTEKYEDIIYISSNPYISSVEVKGFLGTDHFKKVVDVWINSWDEKKGTVLPEKITESALKSIKKNKDKKFIIHYLQPHAPYLNLNLEKGFPSPNTKEGNVLRGIQDVSSKSKLKKVFRLFLDILKVLRIYEPWKIREFLGLEPESPMDFVRRKLGDEGLKKAYRENLKAVLKEVSRLVEHLDGKIVITADHGELLGEGGFYSHWPRQKNKYLIEVPWLVINKIKKDKIINNIKI